MKAGVVYGIRDQDMKIDKPKLIDGSVLVKIHHMRFVGQIRGYTVGDQEHNTHSYWS